MLLQSLRNFTHAGFDPPVRLYSRKPVRYVVELMLDGKPIGWFERSSPETKQAEMLVVPDKSRSGKKPTPLLFADNGEATFGLSRGSDPARSFQRRQSYLELVELCVKETQLAEVQAALTFLCSDPVAQLEQQLSVDFSAVNPDDNITFSVEGRLLVELEAVQSFWANHNDPASKGVRILDCIICGVKGPVVRRWELKVKGIPGSSGPGVALVSADDAMLMSYGLVNSYIAPVCAACSERCTKSLNFLLEREDCHFDFGNLKFAFWAHGGDAAAVLRPLQQPEQKKAWRNRRQRETPVTASVAKSVVEAPYHAQAAPQINTARFYAVALAANPGRAIVRDWIDTTLDGVDRNVQQWSRRHRVIVRETGNIQEFGVKALAKATVRSKAKAKARDPIISVTYSLLRSAILGERLPNGLLHQVIRLCYTERVVSAERVALIKLALLSQPGSFEAMFNKEGFMEQLEQDFQISQDPRTTAAYHCGRALAVLERIQEVDMGRVTSVERMFGAALTRPGLTFPTLVRTAYQVHLPRIKDRNGGAYTNLRRMLDDALGRVPIEGGMPPTLRLQEQGWFILGYHHERADDEAKRNERAARKQRETEVQQTDLFPETDETSI